MSESKIPEEIKQYRPGPCTEIKLISGHYYVYMYQSLRLPSGRWSKKTGKSIGTIIPGTGFIPNRNYHLYTGDESQDEITVLEYGQYALIGEVAKDILTELKNCFTADRASQIFAYACILYANGFVHLDQVQAYYEQSWLSQEYKQFPFKMGKTALGNLLDDLGRRTMRVVNYENAAVLNSSSAVAIDGHAIRCCSDENDLGEAGYKFNCLKEDQVNLLMGYDINTGVPLFARMYRGACNDKSTIEDITELLTFSGILFVVDRGFYSAKNLKLLSANDNTYIIPVPSNTDIFRNVMKDICYTDSFYYRSGKKHARIEYMSQIISDNTYVFMSSVILMKTKNAATTINTAWSLGVSDIHRKILSKAKKLSVYTFCKATVPNLQKRYSVDTKNAGILCRYRHNLPPQKVKFLEISSWKIRIRNIGCEIFCSSAI